MAQHRFWNRTSKNRLGAPSGDETRGRSATSRPGATKEEGKGRQGMTPGPAGLIELHAWLGLFDASRTPAIASISRSQRERSETSFRRPGAVSR